MPGLHLLVSMDDMQPIRHDERRLFVDALGKLKHFEWYVTDVLCDIANMIVGRSYYEGYPFTVFESKNEIALIDGAIYNKSAREVRRELEKISLVESSITQLLEKAKKFLLSTHGEFIVVKYNKEIQKCLILNDALGRLPLYYCSFCNQFPARIVISREVKFLVPFLKRIEFDTMGLAEYLLFGYPLGERMLWKDIKRLHPAAALVIDIKNNEFLLKKALTWNLEPESESINQLQENARKLVNLFLTSSGNIAQSFSKEYVHVVSLSGGLDSRATLAGLVKVGANPIAFSFKSGEDRIVRKVAQTLKVRHQFVSSSFSMTDEDYVLLTDCFSTPKLSHIVSYLYGIRERIGNKAILYTGDGGDKTVSPLSCARVRSDISNEGKLLQYIIESNHIFDIDEIISILNIDKSAFKRHLEKHIMAFPEKTMEGKLVHFMVFERGFKSMFVGEDKNRFFLWSTTPYYSIHFFGPAMKMSQRAKDYYVLYKNFLSGLNPFLSQIQYYDRIIPLSIPDWLLKMYLSIFDWLKRHFYEKGTTSPIDLLSGERPYEKTDEMRKLILKSLGPKSVFSSLEQCRIREITKETTNQAKLNKLAALVVYASHVSSARERD